MIADLSSVDSKTLDGWIKEGVEALNSPAAQQGQSMVQEWNPELVKFLTVSVLVFGFCVLLLMTVLVLREKNAGQVLRLFTVPMVVVASVFLVVTGYSNEQITPVIGLLGTIVGYILGSHFTRTEPPPDVKGTAEPAATSTPPTEEKKEPPAAE